jgi:hypothetical protein
MCNKIMCLIVVFIIMSNSAVSAPKHSMYNSNKFYTEKQLEHSDKMPKNNGLDLESVSPMLLFSKPGGSVMAFIFFLSIMTTLSEAKSLACPLSSKQCFSIKDINTASITSDFTQSLSFTRPNKLLVYFIHPGLISRSPHYNTINEQCVKRNLIKDKNNIRTCVPDQGIMQAFEIDEKFSSNKVYDFKYSKIAWKHISKNYFSKSLINQLPLHKFMGDSVYDFSYNIRVINNIFNTGIAQASAFRPEHALLVVRKGQHPGLEDIDQWENYININIPELKESYDSLRHIADNLSTYILKSKRHDQPKELILELDKKPLVDRLKTAVQFVHINNQFDKFKILTTFLDKKKNYSKEEFLEELSKLKKGILRSFKKRGPIEAAAYAHMRYVDIHPHEDGNGRTARALMNIILMSSSIKPVIFPSNSEYQTAVELSLSSKTYKPFQEFLDNCIKVQNENQNFYSDMINKLNVCTDNCQEEIDKIVERKEL